MGLSVSILLYTISIFGDVQHLAFSIAYIHWRILCSQYKQPTSLMGFESELRPKVSFIHNPLHFQSVVA